MPEILACVFDLSEVLLTGMKGIEVRIAAETGIGEAVVKQHIRNPAQREVFHGRISEEEYWLETIRYGQWPMTPEYLNRIVRENFREIPAVRPIIAALRPKYQLGLLSIHVREWVDFCQVRHQYQQLFDVCSYSFQTQVSKPDPEAYLQVCRQLGVSPKHVLFVDDMKVNVEAAKVLGMQGIQFHSAGQLRTELQKLRLGRLQRR